MSEEKNGVRLTSGFCPLLASGPLSGSKYFFFVVLPLNSLCFITRLTAHLLFFDKGRLFNFTRRVKQTLWYKCHACKKVRQTKISNDQLTRSDWSGLNADSF